jgi:hypothetical protein
MSNPNLKCLSATLSFEQMSEKAKSEIDEYNNRFLTIMDQQKNNTCELYDYGINVSAYLPSLNISKKSCMIKKQNEGSWSYYYDETLKSENASFNNQTRRKYHNNNFCALASE